MYYTKCAFCVFALNTEGLERKVCMSQLENWGKSTQYKIGNGDF